MLQEATTQVVKHSHNVKELGYVLLCGVLILSYLGCLFWLADEHMNGWIIIFGILGPLFMLGLGLVIWG